MSQLPGFSKIPHEQEVQEQDVVTLIQVNPITFQDPRYEGVYYEYFNNILNVSFITGEYYEELDFSKIFLFDGQFDYVSNIFSDSISQKTHIHKLIINNKIPRYFFDDYVKVDILDVSFLKPNESGVALIGIPDVSGVFLQKKIIATRPVYWYGTNYEYDEETDDIKIGLQLQRYENDSVIQYFVPIESSNNDPPIKETHTTYSEQEELEYGIEYPFTLYRPDDSEEYIYLMGHKHYFDKDFKINGSNVIYKIDGAMGYYSYSHLPSGFIGTDIVVYGKTDISDCTDLDMTKLQIISKQYGTLIVSPTQFEALESASRIVQRAGEDFYVWSEYADQTEREKYVKVVVKSE